MNTQRQGNGCICIHTRNKRIQYTQRRRIKGKTDGIRGTDTKVYDTRQGFGLPLKRISMQLEEGKVFSQPVPRVLRSLTFLICNFLQFYYLGCTYWLMEFLYEKFNTLKGFKEYQNFQINRLYNSFYTIHRILFSLIVLYKRYISLSLLDQ